MAKKTDLAKTTYVESLIKVVRGKRVILDGDLAKIYGVPTKVLNQAARRQKERFPDDFAFQLTAQDFTILRSQFVTSSRGSGHGGRRYLPWVYTEHGALMAANVLNSAEAVEMSLIVIRVFVRMREELTATGELRAKLTELETQLTQRLDQHEEAIVRILHEIDELMSGPAQDGSKKRIGFHVKEKRTPYRSVAP